MEKCRLELMTHDAMFVLRCFDQYLREYLTSKLHVQDTCKKSKGVETHAVHKNLNRLLRRPPRSTVIRNDKKPTWVILKEILLPISFYLTVTAVLSIHTISYKEGHMLTTLSYGARYVSIITEVLTSDGRVFYQELKSFR